MVVDATSTIDSIPRAVPVGGYVFALLVGPLYQITWVVADGRMGPTNHLVRVPADVAFEVFEELETRGLEVVDAGSVAVGRIVSPGSQRRRWTAREWCRSAMRRLLPRVHR